MGSKANAADITTIILPNYRPFLIPDLPSFLDSLIYPPSPALPSLPHRLLGSKANATDITAIILPNYRPFLISWPTALSSFPDLPSLTCPPFPSLQELHRLLGSKANATDITAIILHIRQITTQIEELRAASAGGGGGGGGMGSVPASPRVGKIVAGDLDSPRAWGTGSGGGGDVRLERVEAAVNALQVRG